VTRGGTTPRNWSVWGDTNTGTAGLLNAHSIQARRNLAHIRVRRARHTGPHPCTKRGEHGPPRQKTLGLLSTSRGPSIVSDNDDLWRLHPYSWAGGGAPSERAPSPAHTMRCLTTGCAGLWGRLTAACGGPQFVGGGGVRLRTLTARTREAAWHPKPTNWSLSKRPGGAIPWRDLPGGYTYRKGQQRGHKGTTAKAHEARVRILRGDRERQPAPTTATRGHPRNRERSGGLAYDETRSTR